MLFRSDTAAIYGPCAAAYGMEPWHESLEDAFGLLVGKTIYSHETETLVVKGYDKWERESQKDEGHPLVPYHVTEEKRLKVYLPPVQSMQMEIKTQAISATAETEIHMEGRLLGGCMDCLGVLLGTKYDQVRKFSENYKEDGIIWFLEACDLNVMSIRRTIWQMEHAGWFEHVKGFLIGRPLQYDEPMMGLDQYEAVLGELRKHQVPVIMDVDLGHLPPMMPLICGSYGEVTVEGNEITVKMKLI